MADTTSQLLDNTMSFQETIQANYISESDLAKTSELRNEYAQTMLDAPFNNETRSNEILAKSVNEPVFEPHDWHPEDLPNRIDFLQASMDIVMDIMTVDYKIIAASNKYTGLISDTIDRMNQVKERINRNKQRIEDINFITTSYKGLGNVIQITEDDISGSYTYSNNAYTAAAATQNDITTEVVSVNGNGYNGNSYVLESDGSYAEESDDRGVYSNLTDNTPLTVFEYSRLCIKDKNCYYNSTDTTTNSIVNNDTKDVVCTIELKPESDDDQFNLLQLDTPCSGLKIQDVLISTNGTNYKSALGGEIDLGANAYHSANYTAGSSVISFPTCNYVKLVLSSNYYDSNEELGYSYASTNTESGKPEILTKKLDNAIRKVVQLGGISAYNNEYSESSILTSNLGPEEGTYKTIALFANEYIPDAYESSDDPITYTAIVNGQEYSIVPVNSYKDGTKMISCSDTHYGNSEVRFIDDEISTVQIRINLTPDSNGCAPFVGNLKLCVK